MSSFPDYERVLNDLLASSGVPVSLRDGLRNYLVHGYQPGHFLCAVLCNDLAQAVARGDDRARSSLAEIVRFLFNYAPAACWGDAERVQMWIDARRLERRES